MVFNGVTYDNSDLQTFIGHCGIQTDSYGNQFLGMELKDIQSFIDCDIIYNGTITTNFQEPICLTLPCEDEHVLTVIGPPDWVYPNTPYYPTHNGFLYRDTYINNDIFRENMQVVVKGIQHDHFDIRGWNAITYELVEIDTDEETNLTGTVEMAPMPYTSYIPVPGLALAFVSNGKTYYLDNQHDYYDNYFILDNDTIYEGQEITATFTSKMLIDNGLNFYYRINITEAEVLNPILPSGAEWYYEILNDNGSITYQYLYQAGDTIVQDEPTHILVKINTLYDKDLHQDVTHEYVYERDGKVYWWNKTLEEFTVLYDFGAEEGDSWTIKVGTESLTMHVDAVEEIEYEGRTYRMLRVSDPEDLFSGNIIRVEGLRCYWVEDELVFKPGDEDCDAVYEELHGIDEDDPSTGSGTFTVYPNPTNGILTIHHSSFRIQNSEFRITNLMGQTLLTGQITAENQQINVSSLPQGMYFISVGDVTRKFVVR